MKRGQMPQGYTVVEVMIFLTVSGVMFLIAAVVINGRQSTAQFRQSMFDIQTQVKGVINDVSNGYYPSLDNINCIGSASSQPVLTSSTQTQGSNKGCIFLGKVMQFSVVNSDNMDLNVISLAGNQFANNDENTLSATLAQAKPIALELNTTDSRRLAWGTQVSHIYDRSSPAGSGCNTGAGLSTQPGAVGFIGDFGNLGTTSGDSGAQSVSVVCLPGSVRDASLAATDTYIANITDSSILSSPTIVVCFQGTRGQVASLTIGGNGGQALTTSIIFGDPTC
jgi:hypothetical protein